MIIYSSDINFFYEIDPHRVIHHASSNWLQVLTLYFVDGIVRNTFFFFFLFFFLLFFYSFTHVRPFVVPFHETEVGKARQHAEDRGSREFAPV